MRRNVRDCYPHTCLNKIQVSYITISYFFLLTFYKQSFPNLNKESSFDIVERTTVLFRYYLQAIAKKNALINRQIN